MGFTDNKDEARGISILLFNLFIFSAVQHLVVFVVLCHFGREKAYQAYLHLSFPKILIFI